MTELGPFFEALRKVFIVTGILGAIEVLGLYLYIAYLWHPHDKDSSKR